MRALVAIVLALTTMLMTGGTALACAGLIGSNGAVNLVRTTTFVGYRDGVEHYVTAFSFNGAGGQFGSLIPLPGIPTNVERGGDWTLQRLIRETQPKFLRSATAAPVPAAFQLDRAEVLLEKRIDALDVTVLRGGSASIAVWAKEHGFRLSPDAPEVLEFYSRRSPIFLAAVFDGSAAAQRGQKLGDGTPVHITIPTSEPWVPLRILALGKTPSDRVEADVFLLTDGRPALLPEPGSRGMASAHSAPATRSLLDDLRSDKSMDWIPTSGWLTQLRLDAAAIQMTYDLAVSTKGAAPSRVAAGLELPQIPSVPAPSSLPAWAIVPVAAYVGLALLLAALRGRPLSVRIR